MKDDILIFFARSKLRIEVLNHLNNQPQIASFLSQRIGKRREVISRVFLDLQKLGLAKCSNPESPSFRYYRITEKGKEIIPT